MGVSNETPQIYLYQASERADSMKKYKVCVYAICKNEEKFVDEWVKSMSEADKIVVLDTGSMDSTVSKFRNLGIEVHQEIISPWRFDTARNRSLELVDEDTEICVCTDLDERFEKGWREKLESVWNKETKRAQYRYTWNFNEDGTEGVVFWIDKIHSRKGWKWEHPVHEVLKYTGSEPCKSVYAEGIQLNHFADPEKSRAQYLPLLELSVKEAPDDDRNMHYLGREYMFKGEWDKCIETLTRHLSMPSATWADERCASMRYIAKSYLQKGNREEAKRWYFKSIAEAPYVREPYTDFASLLYDERDWHGIIFLAESALKITERPRTYICEAQAWGSLPYELASLGYYYTGNYEKSLEMVKKALELSPTDERLKENKRLIENALKKQL